MQRLLVIDDESLVRSALARVLATDSMQVLAAEDAESGLEVLRRQAIDLAIVDVIMPGMDGVEMIRRIRAEFPQLPIIAISGGGNFEISGYRPEAIATQAYLAAASKAGADAVLSKPFGLADLTRLLTQLLGPRASGVPLN
jgi:CheY-like chemotaxis protein